MFLFDVRLVVNGLDANAQGVVLKALVLVGLRLLFLNEVKRELKSHLLLSVLARFPLIVTAVYLEGHKSAALGT